MWHERFPASVLVTVELNQSITFCDLPLHYLKCSICSQSQNQPFWLVLSVLLVSLALMLFPQQTIAKCTVLATDRKCPSLCCTHQWTSASSGPRAHSSTFCIRLLCWSIDLIQHPLPSIYTIPPLHVSKPSQPCLSNFELVYSFPLPPVLLTPCEDLSTLSSATCLSNHNVFCEHHSPQRLLPRVLTSPGC